MGEYRDKVIKVDCGCGCSSIEISQWRDREGYAEVFISHKIQSWTSHQSPWWYHFKDCVKIIWNVIRGKEYYFYEVVLDNKKQISDFKKAVAELDENVYWEKKKK